MTLDIVLAPLALTPKTFNAGDKVRVTVSFKYTVGVNTTIKLYAGPYYINNFPLPNTHHMVDPCVGEADVSLIAASTPTDKTASVDFTLLPKAQGGIEDGTYGLRVWVEGTNAVTEQDGLITVTGNPLPTPTPDWTKLMGVMVVVMMMGMVMPMMEEAE